MKRIRSKIKGFTLIEVLAIIVILAIISLITVPVVTNVLKQARKKAFVNSVEIATDVLKEYLNENDYSKFELDGVSVVDLKSHSGNKFVSGKFISNNGVIEASYITDGEFCAKGPIRDLTVVKALDSDVYKCRKLDDTEALVDENRISITATTKSIRVIIGDKYAKDDESGIVEYKVTVVGKETKKSENPGVFDFNGLKHNTEYTVKIEITNGNGIVKTIVQTVKTVEISVPTITIANENEWKPSKLVTFTGKVDGAHLEYRIINGEDTIIDWKEINHGGTYTIDYTSNIEKPTYVYARMTDGENIVDGSTKTQTKVDAEAPQIVSNGTVSKQTSTITIPIRVSDTGGSGIDRVICEYGETSDYGNTNNVVVSNTECKISKLSKNKDYFYRVRVLDNAGNSSKDAATNKEVTGSTSTEDIPVPTITITNENDWKNSKTVTFTGTAPGAHLEYKVVNGSTTKVEWTEVSSGGTYTINYPSNNSTPTTIYLRLTDGTNTVDATSKVQTKVDTTAPTVSLTTSDLKTSTVKLTATCVDNESTITKYEFSKDNGSTWINNGKTNTYTFDKLTHNKTYNFKVRCTNGAGTPVTASADGKTAAMCTPAIAITNENDWKNSKIVTFTGSAAGASLQYKVVNGSTTKQDWITVASESTYTIDYTSNVTTPTYIYSRCTDGTNTIDATTKTQTKVDVTSPTCGSFSGGTTTWAKSRTISVGCSEAADNDNSGCEKASFGKNYSYTIKTDTPTIQIKDIAGNTRSCTASTAQNVYVDVTAPQVEANGTITTTTSTATVPIKVTEADSGWKSTSCEYGTSTSYGKTVNTGTASGCTFTGLTKNTKYYYRIRVTDNATNSSTSASSKKEVTGEFTTSDIPVPTITIANENEWKKSKIATFTGSAPGAHLEYKVVNGTTTKVDWTTVNSGDGYTIDYTSNVTTPTYVYLRLTDGTNTVDGTTKTQTKVDVTAPTCGSFTGGSKTWAKSRTISVGCSETADNDNSGCSKTSFGKNYTSTILTDTPTIQISDIAGNTRNCTASSVQNVYVDTTAPTVASGGNTTTTTSTATVPITVTEAHSGWKSTSCEYGTSTSYGSTANTTGTSSSCSFTKLTKNKTYYYRIRVTDNATNSSTSASSNKEVTGSFKTVDIPTPTITIANENVWKNSKLVTFAGTASGAHLEYKVVNGSTTKQDWKTISNGGTYTIDYTSNKSTPTTIYLKLTDGTNTVDASTKTQTWVDVTAPACGSFSGGSTNWAASRTINVACTDTSIGNGSVGTPTDTLGDNSGCSKTTFGKNYTTHTQTDTPTIQISDNAGNTKSCTASSAQNVYVDKTAPVTTAPTATSKTSTITVTMKQTDAHVTTLGDRYYALKTGKTWGAFVKDNNNTHTFTGLTKNTAYAVKTKACDSLGNCSGETSEVAISTSNITTGNANVAFDNANWAKSHIATATFANTNMANAYYFVKPTVDVKINIAAKKCGTSISGTTTSCSSGDVAAGGTLSANNWYKVDGNAQLTFTTNGSAYAAVTDGTNIGDTQTATTNKVDTAPPTYTSAEVKNITTTGYDVYVYGVADTQSGIDRVQFPTWTESGGQDDIQSSWSTNTAAKGTVQSDGTTWKFHVNTTDHKNEAGIYHTHIYIYDKVGRYTSKALNNNNVPTVTITYDKNYLEDNIWKDSTSIAKYSSATTAPSAKTYTEDTSVMNGAIIEFTMNAGTSGGPLYSNSTSLDVGSKYTWSVYLKASKNVKLNIGQEQGLRKVVNVTTSWQKFSIPATAATTNSNGYKNFPFYLSGDSWAAGDKLYVHSLELMKGSPSNSTQSIAYNNALGTLPAPTRTGYTFAGWWTSPVGGTQISDTTKSASSNTTYYAHWIVDKHYLDLNGRLDDTNNGGITDYGTCDITINGVLKSNNIKDYYTQHPYGTIYAINDCKATTGHTYQGVYSGSASGTIGTSNIVVYQQFKTNTYTVKFNGNGNTGGSTANQSFKYGESKALTANGFTRANYVFQGWATSENGEVAHTDKKTVSNLSSTDGATVNLYAVWKDNTAPSVSASAGTLKTDRVTVTATCTDAESGISKYEFSKDNGSTWVDNGKTSSYTFTKLTNKTAYNFKVRCTNGVSMSATSGTASGTTSDITTTNASLKIDNSNWAISHAVTATFANTNMANAYYYVKSTVAVKTNVAATLCGDSISGTTTSCSGDTVAANGNLTANKWYKVAGTAVLTYTANGTAYAAATDGTNIGSTQTLAVTVVDTAAPTVKTVYAGKMLNTDPTFASGVNGTSVYNNSGGGTVTNTRTSGTTPEGSHYLHIKTTGTASPGLGGFTFKTQSAANKVFITRIVAKIPKGYTLNWYSNGTGDGRTNEWLTSQAGTGNWQEYINVLKCGSTGTFSTTSFFAISGTAATASAPVEWDVAYAAVFDTTAWAQTNYVISAAQDSQAGITGYGLNQSSSTAPTFTAMTANGNAGKVSSVTANGTYYAWYKDGATRTNKGSVAVSYVDRTAPTIAANGTATTSTKAITVPVNITDTQVKTIKSITCKAGTSTSNYNITGTGTVGTRSGNVTSGTCSFTGLTKNTKYYYLITATDGVNNTTTAANGLTGNATTGNITAPTITIANENAWKNSKVVTFTGTIPSGANMQYKVVNGTTTKVDWTNVANNGTYTINYTSNKSTPTYVYLRITDGTNTVDGTSKTQTWVDVTAPTCGSWSGANTTYATSRDLKIACTDTSIGNGSIGTPTATLGDNSGCTADSFKKSYTTTTVTATPSVTISDNAGNTKTCTASSAMNVYVDKTAPTIALNSNGVTMNAGKMTVNATATDANVGTIGTVTCKAGTSASSLTITGTATKGTKSGNSTPVTCTFTGLTKGTKYFYSITAADSLGNTSSALTGDGTTGGCAVPTIAIANENAWKNSKVVTFTAGTCSGGKLQYRIKNGSTWKTSSGTDGWVDISSGGTYTINYTSNATTPTSVYARMYDPNNSGNTAEATTKTQTKVDVTAPSCPSSYGGASTTWATSRTLTAACGETANNDNSGCVKTSYSKSYTTTTKTATPSFTLADNAGNTRSCSPSSAMNVYVDKTAPNTTAPTVSSTTSTCVVTMKQTDANVATLGDRYYAIKTGSTWGSFVKDNNNTHTFTGLTKNTQYYVKTKACDYLGNCSGETTEVGCKTGNITAPTITIANENDWKSSKVVTFTGTIPSGAKMQYKVVNGTTTKVDWKDVANNGTYTINYASNTTTPTYVYLRITDGTNTVDGTSKTQTKVDVTNANTTKPTATSDFTSVTVTNKQADGESGIGSVEYGIATSAAGTYTWQTSNKFTGKSYNTKYFVKTRVRNGAGLPSSTTWTESAYTEISTPNPVASNTVSSTTTYYSSLQAAIDASTGGTSTLMRDSTEDVTVASGTNKTVNLNGKTLTGKFTNRGTVTVNGNGSIYGLMRNYGTYTMTNGTIYYGTEGWLAYNEGTFNMNGGFISNSLTTDAVALYNVGTATLKNGEFNSAGYAIVNHGGTMTANSIKVTAGVTGIWSRSPNTSGSTKIYDSDIKVSGTDQQNIGIVSSSIRTDVWDTNVVTSGGYILVTDKYNTNTKDGSLYFYAMKTDGSACAHCTLSGGTIPNKRTFTIAYSSSGYTVRSFGHTNTEKVEFPTWTSKQVNGNAQDDIIWHVGTYSSSGLGKFSQYVIKKSEHNNETGEYQTHFYYTPLGGSRTALGSMTWTYK